MKCNYAAFLISSGDRRKFLKLLFRLNLEERTRSYKNAQKDHLLFLGLTDKDKSLSVDKVFICGSDEAKLAESFKMLPKKG